MQRSIVTALGAILLAGTAAAQQMPQTPQMVVVAQPPQMQANLGGGFIEYIFGGSSPRQQYAAPPQYAPQQQYIAPPQPMYPDGAQAARPLYANTGPAVDPMLEQQRPDRQMDPRFLRQEVEYQGKEEPGTIVIDTPNHFLYLVESGGKAMRYGIGVGREGFTWSGTAIVSRKAEWPTWRPPQEMIEREAKRGRTIPEFMAGGPDNPLGARAIYIGDTEYRIHGTSQPWSIGRAMSSGCIRMMNEEVIDLYDRVDVGTLVVVE